MKTPPLFAEECLDNACDFFVFFVLRLLRLLLRDLSEECGIICAALYVYTVFPPFHRELLKRPINPSFVESSRVPPCKDTPFPPPPPPKPTSVDVKVNRTCFSLPPKTGPQALVDLFVKRLPGPPSFLFIFNNVCVS